MITLRKITVENFDDIIGLRVREDQKELVADNALSIAQSKVQPECIPLAVYDEETPVGFLMYCVDRDDNEYWLYRLMVDEKYQSKGYGRAAMELLLDIVKADPTHSRMLLGVDPSGEASVALYRSLGFVSNGQVFGKEHIMVLEYGDMQMVHNASVLPSDCIWQGAGGLITQQLGKAGGSKDFYVNIDILPPGTYSTKYHSHTTQEEFFLVLRGSGLLRLEGKEYTVNQGDFFSKLPGYAHCFFNSGNMPMEILDVGTAVDRDICYYPDEGVTMEKQGGRLRILKAGEELTNWSSEPN
ncbi:MAG: GNAT family N-acetyltransferase [Angelakisella sp.]